MSINVDSAVVNAKAARSNSDVALRTLSIAGAVVGYGTLIVFLGLIGTQIYRWFRDGEWTHFGVSEALRTLLAYCGVTGTDAGRLGDLVRWLDTPVDWLGLHKVLEVVPASLALFLLSMAGNSLFIYCRDRVDADGV